MLDLDPPTRHFLGKGFNFRRPKFVLALILLLGFGFCGYCDEIAMVSVPIGYEVSGFDRTRSWVSKNGIFSFGFFVDGDGDDVGGMLVGIRYNLGTKSANVPVWTVGGGLRVSENSTIRVSDDGRLILVENLSGLIVWSSNTSGMGVEKATLLDNGNLVLLGVGDDVLWESFDSPTSTLLPGQSLRFPQSLRPLSKKSISSYYKFAIQRSGDLALVWENNVTYWRTRVGSEDIKEVRFDGEGTLGLFDSNNITAWSVASKDFEDPDVGLRRLGISSDGNLRIFGWDSRARAWRVGWQAVADQCNVFGSCGLYSLCGYNSTAPVCDCLYQDSWGTSLPGADSGGFGCKKMVDLGNCKTKTSMMVMKQTVLYGLYPPHDLDMMLSEEGCKHYCSNDTTCVAVTSKNDGSGICTIKRTSFLSGYRNPSVSATSYMKICLVPQAVSARADLHANARPIPMPFNELANPAGQSGNFVGAVALVVLITLSSFLAVQVFAFWFVYQKRQSKAETRIPFGKDAEMNPHYSFLIRLSFDEVKELTVNFSTQLGPSVYKGVLPNKSPIIAKILDNVDATENDFRAAVSRLGQMHHRNLVTVKGFCYEPKHKLLLYEYVPNGSLDKWLFNTNQKEELECSWQRKLDIALGVARALAYLHLECQTSTAHGNLKLENVMLDENLAPKVTEYGYQRLLKKEASSSSSSESQSERDIYMFGEMLLQIIMRSREITQDNLHRFINKMHQEPNMGHEKAERMVRIAMWCVQSQPFLRPAIGEVVKILEGTLSVDRPPSYIALRQNEAD